jgi:hypothetical protein
MKGKNEVFLTANGVLSVQNAMFYFKGNMVNACKII